MPEYDVHFVRSHSYQDALLRAAAEAGVEREYYDVLKKRHEASEPALQSILRALGWDISSHESIDAARQRHFERRFAVTIDITSVLSESDKCLFVTLREGEPASIDYQLHLEDGQALCGSVDASQLPLAGRVTLDDRTWRSYRLFLPAETPLGYHRLSISINGQSAGTANVIVCPDRAYLPDYLEGSGKIAGFNIALYGLRSERNWGCGDFTDLRPVIDWAKQETGFNLIGLNPLHALHNRRPYNTSPYLPLSMFYKNFIYIDIEEVPEFATCSAAQCLARSPKVQNKVRELRNAEFVEYEKVSRLKHRFLKILYREFRRTRASNSDRASAFSRYCEREGDSLHRFALYCALDELLHKQDPNRWTWRDWPEEYRWPDSPATQAFAREHGRYVEFYKYVQFVIEEQLSAAQDYALNAGMKVGLYHDLAVATDRCGSDLWGYRDFYVSGCRVGAPPDDFSPKGQDWGFPPPNAWAHKENGYQLYRESIRKIVRHGGALRIDHVMRFFRLFWIPDGMEAWQGTYVLDSPIDLMRVLALESVRNRNIIIGEDLGTVTDYIRDTLAHFRILSYRVFYFEKNEWSGTFKRSDAYPERALVASSTHDLPTLAGFWGSRDIEARRAAGLIDDSGYWNQIHDRKREKQRMLDALHSEYLLPEYYPRNAEWVNDLDGDVHNAAVGFLAQVPSKILLLIQEDFTKEGYQQNLPGSTAQYPNWQRKMRAKVEDLRSPEFRGFTQMFRDQLARTGRT
jgi:4-alpha-glucanotransferase